MPPVDMFSGKSTLAFKVPGLERVALENREARPMNAMRCAVWAMAMGTAIHVWAQGPLAPPVPPGPMMKTLGQLEPRTPITNAPYTITQPGSYYLATNLSATGHGVIIRTNGVVLDLMGFAILGDRGTTDYGVYVTGTNTAPVNGVVVRNGTVRNFGCGIRANGCHGGRFEGLTLSGHADTGVWLYGSYGGCNGNVIAGCTISGNTKDGINFYGNKGACDRNAVEDCTIVGNGDTGIRLYGYGDLVSDSQCEGNAIRRCAVTGNSTNGIVLDGSYHGRCVGNAVADCAVANNGGSGIFLYGGASGKCQGNALSRCAVVGNGSIGIVVSGNPSGTCDGNAVVGCVVHGNVDNGIHLVLARGNRIEGNHVTDQTGLSYGFSCINTSSNLFLRNSSFGHVYNYVPGAGDTYGPTVTNQGELATIGKAIHPWANFSR